jgi:lipooligosaccharide transport system permease protein
VSALAAARVVPAPLLGRRAGVMVERNVLVYRRLWILLLSGFFEPVFYLFSIGVGIGGLVGTVIAADGTALDYTVFVAPALLATSAMNGAVYETTMNMFFKLKYAKTYDAVLATPMEPADVAVGEIAWAQLRGTLYSISFLVVMAALGLVRSWWALLALPATVLVGASFAAVSMAVTTFMRGWKDFEFVQLAILPMFLFSTTFYPLSIYPRPLQLFVECTPLFHGIELIRALTTGIGVGAGLLWHLLYFAVMLAVGTAASAARLRRLLLT